MDNLNLILLSGGYYCCTPAWNDEPFGKDHCYKFYFPVEGSSNICVDGEWYNISAGNVYFINGFMLEKNVCTEFMKVYWLHFIPESQLLSIYLNNLKGVHCWPQNSNLLNKFDFREIPNLFDNPNQRENKLSNMSSLSLNCYISSLILLLLSDMLQNQRANLSNMSYDLFLKLKPAVEYINNNYSNNISLEDIAKTTFLNPIYFLRIFKKCFNTTPNHYITIKRLHEACRLLTRTDLSIKEISESTGFCNQFYFSKVFKGHFHKTPLEYRSKKLSP